ncbi:sterol desaturase family protein [Roseospira goensis]|uniref:Sterol desaturase/sphingolipid hydroxylase (Fatty acid hydroxylase superfamily) n=1 Tax=Roseospira goensis TaxID=391922 RepID=A0A7W6S1J5_9PROT|nr:sterol desaturase family protein [Roseospira goensis]MBB4287193.1 sterol desaturase/sphingolipid hydroxylase (fatty acid hydroxylase superfamily) [Roseospira goensis]
MSDMLLGQEPLVRLSAFLGVLLSVALWEAVRPRRPRRQPRWLRWGNNLALVAVDTLALRLLLPVLAVGLALEAEARGWGLLNVLVVPEALAVVLSILLLDLVVYLQHVMFHAVPALWRVHRMHHADTEIDVSTGLRFHPVEIVLSMVLKLAVVAALGPPAVAVLLFEVLLNATALFNHANLRLPARVDRVLRWVVVTPDMHRVHHSIRPEETHSNFGFNLPWWDRLLGTYRAQPAEGHDGMTIGLPIFRHVREQWLDRLLIQPWRSAPRADVTPRVTAAAPGALGRRADADPDRDR